MGVPRIGITNWDDIPQEALDRYWSRIRDAGGEIVDLDARAAGRAGDLARDLDGLLLTGGIDVDPSCYGAARHAKVKETAPGRDAMEIEYLHASLERDIPVLAICRGHQLMNVGFGGALVQHIDSGEHRADFRAEGHPSRWHDLRIDAPSRLADALGATQLEINSRHHQAVAVDTLAKGLRPVAYAADHGRDLVEGMESIDHSWVVGVQWHPERLEEHKPAFAPVMRRLFAAFVERAAAG